MRIKKILSVKAMMKKIHIIKWSLIFLVTIQLFTCCSSGDILSQIVGKKWNVISIEEKILDSDLMDNGLPFITFSENGILTGSTSCNMFSGSYKFEGNMIYLEPGTITKRACTDFSEMNFLNALKKVNTIKLDKNNLKLMSEEKPVMTLISEGD